MSPPKPPKNNSFKNAIALTGIAAEMGVIIYFSARGGKWLDAQYSNDNNLFTVIATLLGVAISIWVVLRQLKHIKY